MSDDNTAHNDSSPLSFPPSLPLSTSLPPSLLPSLPLSFPFLYFFSPSFQGYPEVSAGIQASCWSPDCSSRSSPRQKESTGTHPLSTRLPALVSLLPFSPPGPSLPATVRGGAASSVEGPQNWQDHQVLTSR